MIPALTFTAAPANGRVYVFARIVIYVAGKRFSCAAIWPGAMVAAGHSLVWLKRVLVGGHFSKF
jgi:hypothetical protein